MYIYRVAKKMAQFFWYAVTSSNTNRFSKLFHCQNQEKMCNNTITKDPTTPQVCRYTTLSRAPVPPFVNPGPAPAFMGFISVLSVCASTEDTAFIGTQTSEPSAFIRGWRLFKTRHLLQVSW